MLFTRLMSCDTIMKTISIAILTLHSLSISHSPNHSFTFPHLPSSQAGLLRQLSEFYANEASHLFVVRIAQGLNSLGKGLIGLGPFHSDRYSTARYGQAVVDVEVEVILKY